MRRLAGRLLIAGLILATGACSDDGDADAGGTTTAAAGREERQAYLADANAICGAGFAEVEALPEGETPEDVAEVLRRSAAMFRDIVDDLWALTPPSGEEASFDELYGRVEALAAGAEDLAQVVVSGDEESAQEAGQALDAETEDLNADLAAVGLTTCAE